MAWVILIAAGAMEAVWAIALASTAGTRRVQAMAIFLVATALSLGGLALAMREIPTGTAYAVWAGTGAALTVAWAMLTRPAERSVAKVGLLVALMGCVIGLKVTA